MALFRGTVRSSTMQMDTNVNIICPEDGMDPRATLLLLHGMKCNADSWLRMSCVERYAATRGVALILPEVQRSMYADMDMGIAYFTYVAEELPGMVERIFRLPVDPEQLYVGGFSMGGYGSLKLALTYPDRFAGCIALSARCYVSDKIVCVLENSRELSEMRAIYGTDLSIPLSEDLESLAQSHEGRPDLPQFYMACGTEDFLIDENRRMRHALERFGYPLTYEEWPGAHTWTFWDAAILKGLERMLPIGTQADHC